MALRTVLDLVEPIAQDAVSAHREGDAGGREDARVLPRGRCEDGPNDHHERGDHDTDLSRARQEADLLPDSDGLRLQEPEVPGYY